MDHQRKREHPKAMERKQVKVRQKLVNGKRIFSQATLFCFCPKPWDLPFPSYRLLPLSLAFHIFSFLPARISSAGHRHSFSTGSLCLDIPTPPSVLCSPAVRPRKPTVPTGNRVFIFFLYLSCFFLIKCEQFYLRFKCMK